MGYIPKSYCQKKNYNVVKITADAPAPKLSFNFQNLDLRVWK